MSEDRPHRASERGAGRGRLARVFGDGEPPTWWGVPLGSIAGCGIRLHLVSVVFVLSMLVYAIWTGPGLLFVGAGLLAFALIVVLHEAARAHALVRWRGARPVDVTLWPLGGVWRLAGARPGDERVGAAAGLAMLLGLGVGAGLAVWAGAGGPEALVFDPRHPSTVFGPEFTSRSSVHTLVVVFVWQCYAGSLYMLAANLVPMLPLDAALLLRGSGRRPGTDRVAAAGLVPALVLAVGGLVLGQPLVALLGLCGGTVCWAAWQSSRFAIDPAGADRWRASLAEDAARAEAPGGPVPMNEAERGRLEAVLEKISSSGLESLTRAERRILREATERMRHG